MKLTLAMLLVLLVAGCVATSPGGSRKSAGGTELVCHKGKKTLELPREAVQAHLNHGDRPGPC